MTNIEFGTALIQIRVQGVEDAEVAGTRNSLRERVADVVDGVRPGLVEAQRQTLALEVSHIQAGIEGVVVGESTVGAQVQTRVLGVDSVRSRPAPRARGAVYQG